MDIMIVQTIQVFDLLIGLNITSNSKISDENLSLCLASIKILPTE
jgi:hypothetical protein